MRNKRQISRRGGLLLMAKGTFDGKGDSPFQNMPVSWYDDICIRHEMSAMHHTCHAPDMQPAPLQMPSKVYGRCMAGVWQDPEKQKASCLRARA